MNAFELNKIVGGFLMAVLISLLIGHFGDFLVSPRHLGQPVFVPAGDAAKPDAGHGAAEAVAAIEPVAPLLARADVAAGKAAFKQCAGCHAPDKGGRNGIGPALWDVVGRTKAGAPGFTYSPALQAAAQKPGDDGLWTYEQLNHFVANPRGMVPGTKMSFNGVRKTDERAGIIAYLRGQSDSPKPLP